MARPAKAVSTISKNLTTEERERRRENEKFLQGKSDKIKPPKHLNERQKKIFKYIFNELKAAEILGNLDVYILTQCSIAIDRLITIETMVNENVGYLADSKLMATKEKYSKDFYRCCNELSLSPQSRAKISNIKLQSGKDEEDPMMKVIKGGLS